MLKEIKSIMENQDIKCSLHIKKLKTGEIFRENENEVVSSASIIKLFIMAFLFKMVEQKQVDLCDKVDIGKDDKVDGSIITLLSHVKSYTIKDLITLMIIESDNTATNILIDIAGIDNINEFIKDLGFKNTLLQRKMMDFDAKGFGKENLTTAKEVGQFLEKMYKGTIINEKYSRLMIETMKYQRDNRMMRRDLDEEVAIAHKTGDLPGLNHDAGIIFQANNDFIFVMFTWGAKNDLIGKRLIGKAAKMMVQGEED